jgi:integrase
MEPFWREVRELFRVHGDMSAKRRKPISHATIAKRRLSVHNSLVLLRKGPLVRREPNAATRYKVKTPYNLSQKHIVALAEHWELSKMSASFIHCALSDLRIFGRWMKKEQLVPPIENLLQDPKLIVRSLAADRDLSWSGNNVDPNKILGAIWEQDQRVAATLALSKAFALRIREASTSRPHVADKGEYYDVAWGTKGGRERKIAIDTEEKRFVVDLAKSLVANRGESLIPRDMTFVQFRRRIYHILEKLGITRKVLGVTAHGLRHEALQNLYQKLAGGPPPVRAGALVVDREADQFARIGVAIEAGHNRPAISSAYLGPVARGTTGEQASNGECKGVATMGEWTPRGLLPLK